MKTNKKDLKVAENIISNEEHRIKAIKIIKTANEINLSITSYNKVKDLRNKVLEYNTIPKFKDSKFFEEYEKRRKYGRNIVYDSSYEIDNIIIDFKNIVANDDVFPETIDEINDKINTIFLSEYDIKKYENYNDLLKLREDISKVKYSEYFDLMKFMINYQTFSVKAFYHKFCNMFKSEETVYVPIIKGNNLAKYIKNLKRYDRFINKDLCIIQEVNFKNMPRAIINSDGNLYMTTETKSDLITVFDDWSLVFNKKIYLYSISLINNKLMYCCTKNSINYSAYESIESNWWGEKENDDTYTYITRN